MSFKNATSSAGVTLELNCVKPFCKIDKKKKEKEREFNNVCVSAEIQDNL